MRRVSADARVAALAPASRDRNPAYTSYASAQDIPRMADGRPDMRGIWQALNAANWDIQDHSAELGVPAGQGVVEGGELPYLPDALGQRRENYENRLTEDPEAKCFMVGVPRYLPALSVFKSFKRRIRSRSCTSTRTCSATYTSTASIRQGPSSGGWGTPAHIGRATHWSWTSFTSRIRPGLTGRETFTARNLHVVERYTLTGPAHMLYEATIEDPKVVLQGLVDEHALVPPPGSQHADPGV